MPWQKSTSCKADSPMCVEVHIGKDGVSVRAPGQSTIIFTHDEWKTFIDGVKRGEFDLQ